MNQINSTHGITDAPGMLIHFKHADNIDAWLRACARDGIRYIQLLGFPGFLDSTNNAYRQKIERLMDQLDLVPDSFHMCFRYIAQHDKFCPEGKHNNFCSPDPLIANEAIACYLKMAEVAIKMGFKTLVTHVTAEQIWWPSGFDKSDMRKHSMAGIRRVLEKVETWGGKIAVENLPHGNFDSTSQELISFVDELESDAVGICLDTGHTNLYEQLPTAINKLGNRIICTHLHDNNGKVDQHLLPFNGCINWQETITALAATKYNAPYIFEILEGFDNKDPDFSELRQIFDNLMKYLDF